MNPVKLFSILLAISSAIAHQEYLIAFGKNSRGSQSLKLYISSIEPGPVAISVETLTGFSFTGFATNHEILQVEIPTSFEVRSANERNKGIRVTAETQSGIVVNGLNYRTGSTDAFLALPCDRLPVEEYEYYGLAYASSVNSLSHFVIVGCENNTVLQIGSEIVNFNKMETFFWESDNFTGTRVTSNRPLAVFVGNPCSFVPRDNGYCDHLTEQVPPTALWGKRFMSASFAGRASGELYRILASKASTSVTVNCNRINNTIYTLAQAGSWEEFRTPTMSYCSITSDKPILVMQFTLGMSLDGIGDPSMIMVPPIKQYRQDYVFNVFPGFFQQSISIFVTPEHYQPQNIFVDNTTLESSTWNTVYCSRVKVCGYVAYTNMTPGVHNLYHTDALSRVGLLVYGFDSSRSYGYPGGLSLQTDMTWIERTGINAGVLVPCLDCTSDKINLPISFPFGQHYNSSIYVSSNGVISFGLPFLDFSAVLFPSTNGSSVYSRLVIAPYWTDNDANYYGRVSWEMYSTGESPGSDEIIDRINFFISMNSNMSNFSGMFVFVATWSEMHPFPSHRLADNIYLSKNNSYQAVLVTDGAEKSFAIFTFKCGSLGWSGRRSTIGFNARGEVWANHPLSGQRYSNAIACLNSHSVWNNIVYDLTSYTHNTGHGSGSQSILCSRNADCTEFSVGTSVSSCCSTEGVYTYISDSHCLLCYEYGWVQDISEDRQSALPQADISATEGDSIALRIYFVQNGPSNIDYFLFSITTGGTAIEFVDYNISNASLLELTSQPLSVNVQTVDDDVYEGTETLFLTLVQTNSSNNVTYDSGLMSDTAFITVEDNDKLTVRFYQTTLTVNEDVGEVIVTVSMIGKTNVPITVDVVFSGTANEAEDFVWGDSRTLRFGPGGTREYNAILQVVDDTVIEGQETLTITLTNPQPPDAVALLGLTTIIITNDDFPHIGFEQARYTTSEAEGSVTICIIVLTGPVIDSLTVTIHVNSSSATDDDFQFENPPIIEIPSGASRGCLVIAILSSPVVEHDEEIHCSIDDNNIMAVVEDETTTVVIQHDGVVTLGFEEESYTVSEGGLLELVVSKSLHCDFDIHFRVMADGLIYEDRVIQAAANRTMISIILPNDEVALEPDENHVLTLSLLVPDLQVELQSYLSTLTITDDDNTVAVEFEETSTTVAEDSGSIELSVGLWTEVAVPVSVDIVVSNGTALEGKDFKMPQSLHLTFIKKGESQSFSVTIEDDGETEETETLVLSLISSNSSDSVLVNPDILKITITDNDGKESSLSSNNLLLLPLLLVVLIAAAVAVVVTFSCYKRRRQRSLKPPTLQCSNPLGDENHYASPPKASDESTPQSNENKNSGFGGMMGIAVPVLLPLEHRKPSVSVPRGTTERLFDEQSTSMPEPNVSRPRTYRKPSVSAPRSATEPRHGRKPSMTLPSSVVKPERYPKPNVSVPSSTCVPKSDRKSKPSGPLAYRKPSGSVASSDIEPRCDRKQSASTSESTAERKSERQYENIGIFLMPKPGLSDEPEVKENIAYRCIEIPSSEYAVPQPRSQQHLQRARQAPPRPSEVQAVEAYAISTL
jgi:hypothetical protein